MDSTHRFGPDFCLEGGQSWPLVARHRTCKRSERRQRDTATHQSRPNPPTVIRSLCRRTWSRFGRSDCDWWPLWLDSDGCSRRAGHGSASKQNGEASTDEKAQSVVVVGSNDDRHRFPFRDLRLALVFVSPTRLERVWDASLRFILHLPATSSAGDGSLVSQTPPLRVTTGSFSPVVLHLCSQIQRARA